MSAAYEYGQQVYHKLLPNIAAATDAYGAAKAYNDQLDEQNYVALNNDQMSRALSTMAQPMYGAAPPIHHRRHYRHHLK